MPLVNQNWFYIIIDKPNETISLISNAINLSSSETNSLNQISDKGRKIEEEFMINDKKDKSNNLLTLIEKECDSSYDGNKELEEYKYMADDSNDNGNIDLSSIKFLDKHQCKGRPKVSSQLMLNKKVINLWLMTK